ncbi:MAG: CpaF family protein [Planctomycetes bacterium]|nr:CpaF family protein [Planctomycetota bacterium]
MIASDKKTPAAGQEIRLEDIFEQTILHFLEPVGVYLRDPSVTEIMINGPDEIFIERKGQLTLVDEKFPSEVALMAAVRNILQFVGKRVNPDRPMMDARLPDGSRVHVAMRPCSRKGVVVTIRKFARQAFDMDFLVESRCLTPLSRAFLELCVITEKNMLLSGGTSSGKTSLLNVLSEYIQADRRIVTIEESSELQLQQPHVIGLEARSPDRYGRGEVTIRELFKNSLRMRPDRVIVGECRGGEALDMIQAMTSGHAGSMTTLHADSPADALNRLETMALMSNIQIPLSALRAQVASAIHVIVQMMRFSDGSRRVVQISQVLPLDVRGNYQVEDLFVLRMPKGERELTKAELQWTGTKIVFRDEVAVQSAVADMPMIEPMVADTEG